MNAPDRPTATAMGAGAKAIGGNSFELKMGARAIIYLGWAWWVLAVGATLFHFLGR